MIVAARDALDEHIVESLDCWAVGHAQARVVVEEAAGPRSSQLPQFPLEGVIGPGMMDRLVLGQPVQAEEASRTRARSKLTGLSHTICSKVAVSSKPACSSP